MTKATAKTTKAPAAKKAAVKAAPAKKTATKAAAPKAAKPAAEKKAAVKAAPAKKAAPKASKKVAVVFEANCPLATTLLFPDEHKCPLVLGVAPEGRVMCVGSDFSLDLLGQHHRVVS